MIQFLFIGTTELLLIGGIALLLFGGKKLPEMMRGLGQGVKEFKKGVNDVKDSVEGDVKKEENAAFSHLSFASFFPPQHQHSLPLPEGSAPFPFPASPSPGFSLHAESGLPACRWISFMAAPFAEEYA